MLVALCATTFPRSVRATDDSAGPSSPQDAALEVAYRKTIKDGVAEYDARHFEEARSLFRRAHEMSPNARTFRGMGMTSFELRDYVSAVHNLTAALREQRKTLSTEQRKDAQDLLDRSRMFVDVCTLTVTPKDARIAIDAHTPEFEPDGTLLLGFGAHSLEVSAPGKATRSISFSIRGGEHRELSITLEQASVPGLRFADPATPQIATAAKPSSTSGSNRAAAAWLWAGGAAALVAGGGAVYWARQNSELSSCVNPAPGFACTDESAIKRQWEISLGATVVTGAAALTMALIGVLSWKSGPSPAKKHSALDCAVSPFGITCGRAFQ